jgi:endoglucanase
VYNEPLDISWGSVLKPYHEALIATIRQRDSDNVIILGTPKWSQDVDVAAQDPISGTNLIYTLHFYACDHTSWLRDKGDTALGAGLPLFVTEWGATAADGGLDGAVCETEAQAWIDWMGQNNISWTAWKLDGCTDSSCYFVDREVAPSGGWGDSHLNGHAPFVIDKMRQ